MPLPAWGLMVGKVMGPASDGDKERILVEFGLAGGKWNLLPNEISRQKSVCCCFGFHSLSLVKIVRSDRFEIPPPFLK